MTKKRLESITFSEILADGASSLSSLGSTIERAEIERWFETVLAIEQSTLDQKDSYQRAVDALVKVIGLDEGAVVSTSSDDWKIAASSWQGDRSTEKYDTQVLKKVVAEKLTFFEPDDSFPENADAPAIVASPIIDASDRVVGVLCGIRQNGMESGSRGIRRLEALLVQFIADVVSTGLIRKDRQAEASRFQMQLEQFASPKLVQAMKRDEAILEAREREITVLFSDIRGFTALTERVGAEKTFTMIRNLMNQLTGCILDEEGIIMGYAGDGIAAMWNGLADQPDHAELACWAAVNMQKVMAKLSQFWDFVTGEQLAARIGICTGTAHVGNAGSRWRLNYTALGPCVNLASRLEGANKYFGTSILMTESTKGRLFSRFHTRRIGPLSVKGMDHSSDVYELLGEADGALPEFVRDYETALKLFESCQFADAHRSIVSSIKRNGEKDKAALELKSQIDFFLSNPTNVKPVLRLSSK